MRLILLLLFFLVQGLGFSQTIIGTVREKSSGLPLPFANVFVSNTTFGKATDKDGKFRISGNLPQEIEVVASFVGYITEVKKVSIRGQSEILLDFELSFNESNLSEIELKAKRDKAWEREFRRFEEVFLALPDDSYKPKIEIVNPWVVDFEKVRVQNGANYLKASAQEPIKIINRALGYEIDYYLQDFRVLRVGSRFYGQVFYEPIQGEPEQEEARDLARDENYYSSIRYLNQSILLNLADTKHFRIYHAIPDELDRVRTNDFTRELNKSIIPIANDSILKRPLGDGNFRIFLPGRMEIHHLDKEWRNDYYTNIYHAISWIQAPNGYYDVDRNGVLLNPTQLVLSGYLGRQRMARILPLDFEPKTDFVVGSMTEEVVHDQGQKFNRLREKPWITTNKPYYYPGEAVWIGGQMLYQEAIWSDTLSRVIHVDLVTPDSVFQSYQFPIENSRISGGFVLPSDLPVGNYALRAYTNWSLNYPASDQFHLEFPVIDPRYKPKPENPVEDSFMGSVEVTETYSISDSLSYRVMDLELNFLDEFQNPLEAKFVITMTDAEEVSFLKPKSDLESSLNWFDKTLPKDFSSEWSRQIEYGISVQGEFIPANRRQSFSQRITVVRGDLEDFGQVKSDSSGRFWATGLYYSGTAQIAIAAVNEKSQPFGTVNWIPMSKPSPPTLIPTLEYDLISRPTESQFLDTSGDYILLEEFVKEVSKENLSDRYGYSEPDRVMDENSIKLSTTLCDVLQRMGFNCRSQRFGNYTYGERTGSPLLIIDGFKYPFLEGGEFKEMLDSFVPQELESVGVYTYGNMVFGMAGYAGVIVLKTKRGQKFTVDSDRKFNSDGFGIFPVPGFTDFAPFLKNPPSDQYLRRKPTIYWEPVAETSNGQFQSKVKVPYGTKSIHIRVEGRSDDGEAFSKLIKIEL
ncbi:carboxypeptidase-like protein [Algoriphagus aquaeductus]|uniref:Carboxypeptidase-like protein n=1 Tax=Algoriphagus aquaeductus TaxID=475299 RepID=A0A326RS73_9BACT|nr:carboxypeptidase-like regulatory domain-containing protein [Algoriphagus aquaeductus]PZV83868.1 carboxypeptidase-like protein [Algoriphagus aquaeductus]